MRSKWIPILILFLLLGLSLWTGMGAVLKARKSKEAFKKGVDLQENIGSSEEEVSEGEPDILGVLREHKEDTKSIVIFNVKENREEGYIYDSATSVKNRYDKETVIKSLPLGSVIELYFREDKKLKIVRESEDAWDYQGVQNLKLSPESLSLGIGERKFRFDAGLTVINGREVGSLTDILPEKDVLRVRGMEEKVLSISVTEGHGSIDFLNYDEFIGGSIEIGYEIFDTIKENMKYVLREGTYKVTMQNGGLFVNKVITVERNRIRLLDLATFRSDMDKSSEVSFEIQPSDASIFLDGRELDTRRKRVLPYGEYLVKVMKDGYKTFDDILKIKKPREKIKIHLAKIKEGEGEILEEKDEQTVEEERENEAEENDNAGITEEEKKEEAEEEEEEESEVPVRRDESGKIIFLKPLGATVFFDDKAVGVIPCETVKMTGEHTITIKKDGYSSLSYTVDIADDGEDAVFSFPELTE